MPSPVTSYWHTACPPGIGKMTGPKLPLGVFVPGQAPVGWIDGPSLDYAADKSEFGHSRIERWFGRDWTPLSPRPATAADAD